jgi:hypothetical protein
MEVRMADAAGLRLDDDLPWTRRRNLPLTQDKRLAELLNDSGLHRPYVLGGCGFDFWLKYGCAHGFLFLFSTSLRLVAVQPRRS